MANNPKRVVDAVNKVVHDEIREEIDKAFSDLFEDKNQHARLPEAVFVNNFLPYFSGKVKDDRTLNITTNWIAVAGSASSPVDVVDGQDQVLFTVPPLMSTDFLRSKENIRGRSFNQILANARNQGNRLPVLGTRALINDTKAKLAGMTVQPTQQAMNQWEDIFNRYNIPTPGKKGAPSSGAAPADDELDFG